MCIRDRYPASPRRITVLVNFQAILLIFSGETSSNRDIFFTEDAAKNFFPSSKRLLSWNSSHSQKGSVSKMNPLAPKAHNLHPVLQRLNNQNKDTIIQISKFLAQDNDFPAF